MKGGTRRDARVLLACGSSFLALSAVVGATGARAQETTQSAGQQTGQQSTATADTLPATN